MAFFIEQPEKPVYLPNDRSLTFPPSAIEHGVGLEHNPHFDAPAVPEPGAYAVVFGVLLVGFAAVRKLKRS